MTHMYFISSSGFMQFREVCYTVVSYAPYTHFQIYAITNLATFRVTIFDFFHPGPQPNNGQTEFIFDHQVPHIGHDPGDRMKIPTDRFLFLSFVRAPTKFGIKSLKLSFKMDFEI